MQTHTATEYQGQIHWTYSGQGIDMEHIAKIRDLRGTSGKTWNLKP